VLAEAETGAANVAAVGEEQADQELRNLLDRLCGASGRDAVVAVCAGVAGADSPGAREEAERHLRRLLPNARVLVVHDARLVLAAGGLHDGIALIGGTGSIAYGRARGREARAGGWGHLLGDEGSGFWVVREGIRRVLADHDAQRPPGAIAPALLDAAGCRDVAELILTFHERRAPGAWAALAGVVLVAAPELAVTAGHELAGLVSTVSERLRLSRGKVLLAGGFLLHNAAVERSVREVLALRIPGLSVARLTEPPVAGAARLALALSRQAGD